ncbi:MAG: formate dehydrogenase accessory sulfurtransferase FdhD [Rhodobacteraceae bacterium]|nr:formate dehydrogenase accessory sulfurtransferase FdhD [Paracoccaceae bacterium]
MTMQPSMQIAPDPTNTRLMRPIQGHDQSGRKREIMVVEESALTLFLNTTEIITAMTIGDYPAYLALGFLFNQGMISDMNAVTGVDIDDELNVVVVRTREQTDYEDRLAKKIRTSGCAMGTVFGDLADMIRTITLTPGTVRTSWLYALTKAINTTPSLYLAAGAIHGCVLCHQGTPLVYMEDVGRHNAVDKIAGWMKCHAVQPHDKILYTTGRLTSEMILKSVMMEIPVLVSRSGFTAWGVELARTSGLTLIGRLRGRRYLCLSGEDRLIRDDDKDTDSWETP